MKRNIYKIPKMVTGLHIAVFPLIHNRNFFADVFVCLRPARAAQIKREGVKREKL